MTSTTVPEALQRVEELLFRMQVLEAFIARREAGGSSDDVETAGALVRELLEHQGANGSWGSSLQHTAEALLLLADLQPFDADVGGRIAAAVSWLRQRQRAPGAFPDRCSSETHAGGLCHHFAGGFFSPGPTTVSFAGATLSTGVSFPSDDDARLALSALALRAVLNFASPSIDDSLQLEALMRIAERLFREHTGVSIPASVTLLAALARAPRSAAQMTVVHGAFSRLAGAQRADGSWPGAEPFHVAEAFLFAVESGYGSPAFDSAISRTAQMLLLSQQPDGSWGHGAEPYRLLTAWRTLRYVTGIRTLRAR